MVELEKYEQQLLEARHEKTKLEDHIAQQSLLQQNAEIEIQSQKEIINLVTSVSISVL